MLTKITRVSVTESVVRQITEGIASGSFALGSKLPPERELMARMEVSRSSVREALGVLETLGIVESVNGVGTFVRRVSPGGLIRPEILSVMLMGEGFFEIQETRKVLECAIARKAALSATEDDFAALYETVASIMLVSPDQVFERTWDFHRQLADSAGNGVMAKLLGSLYDMVKASQARLYSPYVTREQEHEAHMKLLSMLKKRDPEAAYRGMLDHLTAVDEVVKRNMAAIRGSERQNV